MNADDQDLPSMEDLNQKAQTLQQQRNALLTDVSWSIVAWLRYLSDHLQHAGGDQGQTQSAAALEPTFAIANGFGAIPIGI